MTLRGDLLLICSQSSLYSEPLIGSQRSCDFERGSASDPLPKINKFLTFDSISTSNDESDVLKIEIEEI